MKFIHRHNGAGRRESRQWEGNAMGETPVSSSGDNRAPSFGLDEEQQAILDQADRFAHKELYPLCERMDRDEWGPEAAFPKIGDNGFFGVTIPEEYGGARQRRLCLWLRRRGVV